MAVRWQSGLHHPVSVYAKQVTQGRLRGQCCKYEILACQRHLDDLKRQGTEDFPYVFDTTRADRIIRLQDGRIIYDGDAHAPEAVVTPHLSGGVEK